MEVFRHRLVALVLALAAAAVCAACTVPVPDPGNFGQPDQITDIGADDTPDTTTDIAPDLIDDANPDLSPDLVSDSTDTTDTTETTEPDQTADQTDTTPDILLPECTTSTDCDDNNPCTDDTCNPATGCAHQMNTLACTDNDACTTNTTCQNGACAGPALACDDANLCTDDTCDKLEGCVYLPNSVTCTDGNACTQADTCADSFCKGTPLACNDGNPCTDDACDKALGCTTTPNASTCDDGNACTTGEACTDGTCLGGGELGCDDGIPCTSDGCDPAAGCTHGPDATACNDSNPCTDDTCQAGKGCVYLAADATCTDGNECTTGEACAGGKCAGGNWTCACATDADCDDKNPCTTSTCQAGTCQTANAEDGTACDDGDACVSGDVCSGGACDGAVAVNCDDDNECTFDLCEPKLGCLYLPHTMACDDGDPCTVGEACAKKSCTGGTVKSCGDGNACTDDACIKGQGCANTPNTKPCEDGNACTVGDACKAGTCAGAVVSCDDGFACTTDTCNSGAGSDPCVYTPKNGLCDDKNVCTDDACLPGKGCVNAPNVAPCDDGNACTKSDACSDGSCKPGAYVCVCKVDGDCDDKNACTKDTCEGGLKCVNAAVIDGAICDDGTACTTGEACTAGKCSGGKAVSCDDANPCTADSCDAASGCKHGNTTVACNDNDACTVGEACAGGACVGGVAKACDDSNLCTDDGCEPASGCVHTANSVECADGNACTTGDACAGAKCVSGPAAKCNDGNVCTDDSCKPLSGCVNLANAVTCTDGDACTTVDACKDKACVGGLPPVCADGNVCTDDSCDKTKGCVNAANKVKCDDSDACTTVDVCADKACVGATAPDCDDGNVCTDDGCDAATGCVSLTNAATCTDGDACTLGDTCAEQACVPGEAPNCDDGNACTDDACDKTEGCLNEANAVPCDDGQVCTLEDSCSDGKCAGKAEVDGVKCDEGKLCVAGACLAGGACVGAFDKTYGGAGDDTASSIAVVADGFAIAGRTKSKGAGATDMWLVKTDGSGNAEWDKTYGGTGEDGADVVLARPDGGYTLVGATTSKGAGNYDGWVVRTDASGVLQSEKTLGGSGSDGLFAADAWPDGSVIAVGITGSKGPCNDGWAVRFAASGSVQWEASYDTLCDVFWGVATIPTGGAFIVGGRNDSPAAQAAWLVRIDDAGKMLWQKYFQGVGNGLNSVVLMPDGGIAALGMTAGSGDTGHWRLMRLDSSGNVLWQQTYSTAVPDSAYALAVVPDGGFLLVGTTNVLSAVAREFAVVRVDAKGKALWEFKPGSGVATSVVPLADGGLLAAGFGFAQDKGRDLRVVRLDPLGNASCKPGDACFGKTVEDCDDAKPCTADWCDGVKGCQHATMPEDSPCGAKGFACTAAAECAPKGMVPIPVGAFQMGCVPGDGDCDSDEGPRHEVLLDAFYVDAREVSVAAYATCVTIGNCTVPASGGAYLNWGKTGRQDHPVNGVTWAQSAAYCSWAGKRLPTEAEWEKAARGGLDGTLYPWGNEAPTCSPNQKATLVWYGLGAAGCGKDSTWAVGTGSSKNGYGLLDMAGNVWEWVSDWRGADYYATATKANPPGPVNGTEKVIRGGCYANTYKGDPRASKRVAADPAVGVAGIGFRCARTVSACDPFGCDDSNACTTDTCDEKAGKCTHVAVAAGSSCPNGGLCSALAKCVPPPAGMVGIPAGTIKMGCVPGDNACQPDEGPRHDVTLDAYYLGTTEVTVSAYATCVAAEKCTAPKGGEAMYNWAKIGREQHPVNGVTWPQAEAYCKWTGGRLPTEAEWERAARGGLDGKKFPWGDEEPTCTQGLKNSVVKELGGTSGYGCGTGFTFPVGTGSAKNAFGLYDMAGNVWEWVADWYGGSHYSSTPTANPMGPESGAEKVLRGGSFFFQSSGDLRVSNREDYPAAGVAWDTGFRCARSVSACDPLGCDDGNACTTDACDEKAGKCTHLAVDAGSGCAGGGLCSADAKCVPPPAGMAGIPAGKFWMGCVPGDSLCGSDEEPRHAVQLGAYYMDVNEVTVAKFQACVSAGKCDAPGTYSTYCNGGQSGRDQHPVNCVTWYQSDAYCKWAGGQLPTEAEWEKAARGGLEGKKFPWGDSLTCAEAVWDEGSGVGCDGSSTMPVGSKSAGKNAYGLNDMAGNVWEWVADWYGASYYGSSPGLNPQGPSSGSARVRRGGGFGYDDAFYLRASLRVGTEPSFEGSGLGFRCSRSYP